MTTELKPCPFLHCRCASPEMDSRIDYFVRCGNPACNATGPDAETVEQAAELWNAAPRRDDVPVAVAVPEKTLHDEYVMAALTGWSANPASGDCTVKQLVDDAMAAADEAMKARGA